MLESPCNFDYLATLKNNQQVKELKSKRMADLYVTNLNESIFTDIEDGCIAIHTPKLVSQIISLKESAPSPPKQLIQKELYILKEQLRGKTPEISNTKLIFTKQRHRQIVEKIMLEKKKHNRQRIKSVEERQFRDRSAEEAQKIVKAQQEQEVIKRKHSYLLERLADRKEKRQQFQKQCTKAQIRYKQVRDRQPLHHQMEQKFQLSYIRQTNQQTQQKLNQIKQMHRQISLEEIKEHQRQYNQAKLTRIKKRSNDWKYVAPDKPQKLQKMLELEHIKNKMKKDERKRMLSDRQNRIKGFLSLLKERYVPRHEKAISTNKSSVVEKESKDAKKLGIQYLAEVCAMKKKRSSVEVRIKTEQTIKTGNKSVPWSEKSALPLQVKQKKQIINIIRSSLTLQEKKDKLALQVDKLHTKQERTEQLLKYNFHQQECQASTQLLLSQIQTKLALIELDF